MGKRRSKYDLELLRQTQAAEAEIDSIYREAVRRVTRLGYSREAPDGKLFSFDEAGAIVSQQFNAEQKRLMMSVASAIREDVRKSWKLANSKNDKMVQTVLNGRGLEITDRLKRRYFSTNDEALAAFIGRKNNGLGLSERVWRYAEQFKSEIEMAIDIGLRDGRSADALSRDVRAYLRNPDKLFRRVRDEHGQLVLSKAAKAYHPGRGVYRSSYKNARRLASTETNMAYHKADKERWAQLDFIVGFRVEPSKNHPEPDICDDLKGEYPKTFDFSGWHPHCRCHAVPIMKTDDEMMKDNAALLAGAEPSENSENTVKNVPAGFSEWVKLNGARIDAAKSLPYFIRDNKAVVDSILDPQPVRAAAVMRTPEELAALRAETLRRAKIRHDARTPEQERAIRQAWYERRAQLTPGCVVPETLDEMKKRLGDELPKTLPNLENAIAEYEKWTNQYGPIAREHKEDIENLMRKVFDTHDMGLNINDTVLDAVFNSYFKNTFEVGTSGGFLGSTSTKGKIGKTHGRLLASHRLFGIGDDVVKDQLARKEYEKYGNLLDHNIVRSITNNSAKQYGNVEVRFKKNKIVATWTAGDSLMCRYQPSLVSDPRSSSFDNLRKTPTDATEDIEDFVKFRNQHCERYLELQYHGKLTVDCVESITFPYDIKDKSHSHFVEVANKWKSVGVRVYYVSDETLHEF